MKESTNHFGKVSRVSLQMKKVLDKQVLHHVDFTAPFKVMKPFYDAQNNMSVMIMSSSAGVMSGDRQSFSITLEPDAQCKVYSQSYEKIHKMEEGYGTRQTTLSVATGASLHYAPLPTIPYEDSHFVAETDIFLADTSSTLIYSEILSAGRVARGEVFAYGSYRSKIRLLLGEKEENELIFFDNTHFVPSEMDLSGFCMHEGYTHQGMLLFCHQPQATQLLPQLLACLDDTHDIEGGCTVTAYGDVVCRTLGRSGESLEKVHARLATLVEGYDFSTFHK